MILAGSDGMECCERGPSMEWLFRLSCEHLWTADERWQAAWLCASRSQLRTGTSSNKTYMHAQCFWNLLWHETSKSKMFVVSRHSSFHAGRAIALNLSVSFSNPSLGFASSILGDSWGKRQAAWGGCEKMWASAPNETCLGVICTWIHFPCTFQTFTILHLTSTSKDAIPLYSIGVCDGNTPNKFSEFSNGLTFRQVYQSTVPGRFALVSWTNTWEVRRTPWSLFLNLCRKEGFCRPSQVPTSN